MKKICVFLIIMVATLDLFSQVTIGTGKAPAEQALLDLKEFSDGTSNKGLLLPRVSLVSTNSPAPMSSFVAGLVVFNTATSEDRETRENLVIPGFYYCDGARWIRLTPVEDIHIPAEPWLDARTGTEATSNTQNIYQNAQVGIGKTGTINASAQLEITSSDKGLLIPRLDTRQRDAIQNPTQSLLIWNTDENCFNFWKNNKWRSMCGDSGESVIKITPVDCQSATVVGTYKVGEPTTNANYIDISIEVIEPGAYVIEGQTNAGFFFQKSGVFTVAGTYDIQIPAMGKPNKDGTLSFNLTLNGVPFDPTCTKEVVVDPASVQFSFDPSYCGVKTHSDELAAGESTTGKTIKVKVNVANPGVFNFSTNTVFGVQYTANNVNLAVGSHEVTLYANGNPPTSVGNDIAFTVTGRGQTGNDCQVLVDIIYNKAAGQIECSSARVFGSYKLDVPTGGTHYIEVPVNFTTIGVWTATATNATAGFQFSGQGTVSATGRQVLRLYASGTPTSAGEKEFTISINDVECKVNVSIIPPTKYILSIGNVSASIENALKSAANFGPNGVSKVEEIQVIRGVNNPTAAQLMTYINTNKIDIIIVGWNFYPQDAAANVIADFIKNKKGYYFQVQGQGQQAYLKLILDKAYGGNIKFEGNDFNIYTAKLSNENHPILNGVFGDARGKYLRADDAASWTGIAPTTVTPSGFGSLCALPVRGGYVARNILNYAPGFFIVPDWGSLNYILPQYGSNNPISYSTQAFNGYESWNGTSYGPNNLAVGEVANWILFGNTMDHAIKYVEQNTNKEYQVSENHN